MIDDGGTGSAVRLIAKVKRFSATLDDDERALFAALLAPGIDAAWTDTEQAGPSDLSWEPGRLPRHLARAVRGSGLRIDPEAP